MLTLEPTSLGESVLAAPGFLRDISLVSYSAPRAYNGSSRILKSTLEFWLYRYSGHVACFQTLEI